MKVGIVYNSVYLEHDTGTHVENAQRLIAVNSLLEESRLTEELSLITPRPASVEEVALVHAKDYILQIQKAAQRGGGWLDMDTIISPASYEVALYAAGGVLKGIEALMNNEMDSVFALVRPPGHHATCWQAMGFCLFNNIAIAAKFALANYNLSRILIVDFDVHHGNGTQDTFYAEPKVLYFSTHQSPLYPGTGSVEEIGNGAGEGTTVNVPLVPGCGDEEYVKVFHEILVPIVERFQPELLLVSAGYDAHWADSISSMQVSVGGFARMVEVLKNLAIRFCKGRILFALEGGYHHQALANSVKATLEVILGHQEITDSLGKQPNRRPLNFDNFIQMVKKIHGLK